MTIHNTALKLINEHGSQVTISRSSSPVDDVSGKILAPNEESFTAYAVPTRDRLRLANAINGTASNERMYMLDSSVEPKIEDEFSIDNQVYKISSIEVVYYQGKPVYYNIRVAK